LREERFNSMSNYPAQVGAPTILEVLEREGILIRTVNRLADSLDEINKVRRYNKLEMRDIIKGLANTAYIERRFTGRFGDATMMSRVKRQYRIRLLKNYRETAYSDYIDTLLHELAHVVDFMLREKSDHSKVWKYIATVVGANPTASRKPTGDLKELVAGKYKWGCSNEDCDFVHTFNRRKSKPMSSYSCGKCRSSLVDLNGNGGCKYRKHNTYA